MCIPNFLFPVKLYLLKHKFKSCGTNFKIGFNFTFTNPSNVVIGKDIFINNYFYCSNEKELIIYDRVMFGSNCSIIGGDHKYNKTSNCMRFDKELGDNRIIIIEHDAWIGHGALLLKNAYIGEGAIVGANSIVNSKISPYSIYIGQPAHFLKPRFQTFNDLITYLEMMDEKYGFKSKYTREELEVIYKS